ncbi:MAG: TadE/TadG family type IV pilus assembly protein [Pyrinomonadaceae bacterium]
MKALRIDFRNSLRDERGAYFAEFAIVAPVLLLLMFGVMEFGRAVWAYSSVAHAAREGVRYAIVRGGESGRAATANDVQTYARSRAGLNAMQVSTTWTPDNAPGSVVQVTAQYDFQSTVPFIPPMQLTSTSRMVISF